MTTVVSTIFTGLSSAASTAGSAIASGAEAATGALASGAEAATGALSGISAETAFAGATAGLSAAQSIRAGQLREEQLEVQAQQQQVQAETAELQGLQQQNRINEQFLDNLAQQNVNLAASGLSLSSGSGVTGREQARAAANRRLSTSRTNAQLRSIARRQQGQSLLSQGESASRSGFIRATQPLLQFGANELGRRRRREQRAELRGGPER